MRCKLRPLVAKEEREGRMQSTLREKKKKETTVKVMKDKLEKHMYNLEEEKEEIKDNNTQVGLVGGIFYLLDLACLMPTFMGLLSLGLVLSLIAVLTHRGRWMLDLLHAETNVRLRDTWVVPILLLVREKVW
ncbi:hypothetical protein VPH35_111208 [Triticum aestivum]